jgi:hypothetical protein
MNHPARNLVLALMFASGASAISFASAADQPQPAKWVSRDVNYTYQGFTSQYSCDALRRNVVTILRALGARKNDLKIQITPCAAVGTSQISFSPGVRGTISVLVPATADEVSRGDPHIVPAHWKLTDVVRAKNLDTKRGSQCELLEQSKRYLLPLFSTRNLDFSSDCVPNQIAVGSIIFKAEVLQPDSKPTA